MPVPRGIPLAHLDRMTDSTGLIQHAIYGVPRRESGYTTDDNARALRLCTRLWGWNTGDDRMLERVARYLSFVEFARRPGGGFHNFLSYQRTWLDAEGTCDCQGQAVRALAEVLGSDLPDDLRVLARELIEAVLPAVAPLRSVRALAYLVLAWGHLRSTEVTSPAGFEGLARFAAQRLADCYQEVRRSGWMWFEPRLTYANAVLPHALFEAARWWPDGGFRAVAEESFGFLDRITTADDHYWPIGNDGWYPSDGAKAGYDQQPVEAATTADAAIAAYNLTGDDRYRAAFHRARDWFHGKNSLGQRLADAARGACAAGLDPYGANRNQGAESTLAYLDTELLCSELADPVNGTLPTPSWDRSPR